MRQWLKERIKRYMVLPIIYGTLSRFLSALTLALLWNRFVNTAGLVPVSHAFTVLGLGFFALAWFNYLRLDGINLPLVKWLPLSQKKRSLGAFSDMSDYLDEEIVSLDELAQEERDACNLLVNTVCGVIFLLLPFAQLVLAAARA